MISVEEGILRSESPCADCGAEAWSARGFVYRDGNADTVYFASWAECAPRLVRLAVVVGDWGSDTDDPLTRRRIGMYVDYARDPPGVMVVDPVDSPWDEPSDISPRMLSRRDALVLPEIAEIFHAVDHIVTEDSRIAGFLAA